MSYTLIKERPGLKRQGIMSLGKIAQEFDVTKSTVGHICSNGNMILDAR
jgi:hypothetical protein